MTRTKLAEDAGLANICSTLKHTYASIDLGNKPDPLDELVFIMLTVKTDYHHYGTLWDRFKASFPRWNDVLRASEDEIATAISFGGLQLQKAQRIKRALKSIHGRIGNLDLTFLRQMSDEDVETFLLSLDGVGKKVARCVMMYSLGKPVFPVDSNVLRICRRLGLIDNSITEGKAHDILQQFIPEEMRHSLHVGLVSLGRDICTERRPKCARCPLVRSCKFAREAI